MEFALLLARLPAPVARLVDARICGVQGYCALPCFVRIAGPIPRLEHGGATDRNWAHSGKYLQDDESR